MFFNAMKVGGILLSGGMLFTAIKNDDIFLATVFGGLLLWSLVKAGKEEERRKQYEESLRENSP